jgi:superoxide dismutase, Fe-Mn family
VSLDVIAYTVHNVLPPYCMSYIQADLPYEFNDLEPHIDAQTMEIHFTKHHAGYVAKLNTALEDSGVSDMPIDELIANINDLPKEVQTAVRNNGGGHANHSLFWSVMTNKSITEQSHSAALKEAVQRDFSSPRALMDKFATAATNRFGSGWAWLVVRDGKLKVCHTANQDNPLMGEEISGCSGTPILGLDVWEHAYYLHYQNRRPDYITAFFNIINWEEVGKRYEAAIG